MNGIGPVTGDSVANLRDVLGLNSHFRNAAVALPGCAGGWQLGEASGTVARDEMKRSHGVYAGSPTLAVAGGLVGQPNTSVTFSGTGQWAEIASYVDVGGDITLMCLIKTTYAGVAAVAMGLQNAGSPNSLYLGVLSSAAAFSDGVSIAGTTAGVNDDAWHLIAGTVTGATMRCYADGVVSATTATTTNPRGATTTPSLAIGAFGNVHNYPMPATMMQAYIYQRALSADELLRLWQIARAL